jgi:hypothetical protein
LRIVNAQSRTGGFRAIDVLESRDVADHVAGMVAEATGAAGENDGLRWPLRDRSQAGLAAPTISEFETHNLLLA